MTHTITSKQFDTIARQATGFLWEATLYEAVFIEATEQWVLEATNEDDIFTIPTHATFKLSAGHLEILINNICYMTVLPLVPMDVWLVSLKG